MLMIPMPLFDTNTHVPIPKFQYQKQKTHHRDSFSSNFNRPANRVLYMIDIVVPYLHRLLSVQNVVLI